MKNLKFIVLFSLVFYLVIQLCYRSASAEEMIDQMAYPEIKFLRSSEVGTIWFSARTKSGETITFGRASTAVKWLWPWKSYYE